MTISNVKNAAAANLAASMQEAMETAAQTKTEATKGDRQAIRRLARMQAAPQTPQAATPPTAATDGPSRRLDASA